jgi:Ankyrin repeat
LVVDTSLFDHSNYSKPAPSTTLAVPRRLTKVNEKGETRLHVAARLNKFENLIKMIADGADINAKDYAG